MAKTTVRETWLKLFLTRLKHKSRTGFFHFFWLPLFSLFLASSSHASIILDTDLFASADPYGMSPHWDWKQIQTQHFNIVFPKELTPVAHRTATLLEEAHLILSPHLQWEASYRVTVRLLDNTDSANGLTSAAGRFGLILWMTPPDTWFSTYTYDDWLRLLILHEYTHYLNMDAHHGIWNPVRYIFGYTGLPNSLWAPWMLEGLAVYDETVFTQAGRGRSTYYDMVLRAAVAENVLNTRTFVTLDKVNGSNPYFPSGDIRYQFGYHMMNELAALKKPHLLGDLSISSSARVPYFINGNLEDLVGQDWSSIWKHWVETTQTRMQEQIRIIKTQPLTSFRLLTLKDPKITNEVTGIALSPEGKWIAYTSVSADRRQGLYLLNRKTGQTERLSDKLYGVGLQFTPDSQALVYSELNQQGQFTTYSELKVVDLKTKKNSFLTEHLRAKDPDVSPDGNWVVFTFTEVAAAGLARARLLPPTAEKNFYHLGPIEKLLEPALYDLYAQPKFSADGKKIYFTYHPNGQSQMNLLEMDLETRKTRVLVADGFYNRFIAVHPSGELYYISNLTGVDNLYHFDFKTGHSTQVTNLITGVNFPFFGNKEGKTQLYGSVFSFTGWDVAEIDLPNQTDEKNKPIQSTSVTVPPPPVALPTDPTPAVTPSPEPQTVESYSPFSSLAPRVWTPLLLLDSNGLNVGAEGLGFDSTNQHRYLVAGAYQANLNIADGFLLYSNRTLGPDWVTKADYLTIQIAQLANQSTFYTRRIDFVTSLNYPFLWTYSSLTPYIGFNLQRELDYNLSYDKTRNTLLDAQDTLPSFDGILSFSNLEISRLSITAEGGRFTQAGVRYFPRLSAGGEAFKLLVTDEEHLRVTKHSVLIPSVKTTWVSHVNRTDTLAAATVMGRSGQNAFQAFQAVNFNQMVTRGYPGQIFLSKLATVAALDFQFPIVWLFGGPGTLPVFFESLYGVLFLENTFLVGALNPNETPIFITQPSPFLPSAGGALRVSTQAFYNLSVVFSGELHHGFASQSGGASDLFFQILLQGFTI